MPPFQTKHCSFSITKTSITYIKWWRLLDLGHTMNGIIWDCNVTNVVQDHIGYIWRKLVLLVIGWESVRLLYYYTLFNPVLILCMDNYYSTQNCIGNTLYLQWYCKNTSPFIIGLAIVNNYRNCNQEIATKCFGNKSVLENTFPLLLPPFSS